MPNKDEIQGKGEQVKGKIKEGVGDLTNNPRLEREGMEDQAAGKVQENYGTAKRKVGEAVEEIGERIKR